MMMMMGDTFGLTMAAVRSRIRPRQRRNQQQYLFWCYFHSLRILSAVADAGERSATFFSATSTARRQTSSASSSEFDNSNVKGQLNFRSPCYRNWVRVTKLVLTCDSPGAYYYGSTTYRNSETCATGDKARIGLSFTISSQYRDQLQSGSSNAVLVTIESGLYNQFVTVLDSVNLCQLGVKGNNAYLCPKPGSYQLQTYYYVPSHIREAGFHYTPDLRITFYDSIATTASGSRLLLGCVTSGALALHQSADEKASRGSAALGISVLILVSVFGWLILWTYLRKKRLEREHHEKAMTRYSYFRTLPSGQVIPMPAGTGDRLHQSAMMSAARGRAPMLCTVPSMQSQSSTDESGLSLSGSPSARTRPVI